MRFIKIFIIGLLLPSLAWAQEGVPVRYQLLSELLVDFDRKAPAEVRTLNDAKIASEVSAVVNAVHADVGQMVAAGDLLIELNPVDYQLNLKQSEANLASSQARLSQAQAKLKRSQTLVNKQYVSADELLERETDVMVFQAQIQANEVAVSVAKRDLEKCNVKAPFDGVIGDRKAQVGNFVRNGEVLIAVTQVDRFELDATIPDSQASEILNSDTLRFISRGQSWPVELLRLSPVINSQGRTRQARFTFVDEAPAIGRSGEIAWRVGSGLLPANLVSRRGGELGVFLLEGDKARFQRLPGAQEGRPARVDNPGSSQVITLGRERLQDGVTVSVQR